MINSKYLNLFKLSLFITVLLLTYLVYSPGLSGGFIFDDYPYIANNDFIKIQDLNYNSIVRAAVGANYNPLGRPISMLSFGLTHYFSGLDPYYFKLWNLIIHLINGVLVLIVTKLLLKSIQTTLRPTLTNNTIYWISLVTSFIWLLHPINLTSVLYAAQRMTSLTTVFIFTGLIIFLWGRIKLFNESKGVGAILTSLSIFTLLSTLSKENGILLIYYIFIIELIVFRLKTKNNLFNKKLLFLYSPIVFSILIILLFLLLNPEWLTNEYLRREFTLFERLLTETRVIFFYLGLILLPDLNQFGIFHDDFLISTGFFTPFSTLIATIGIFSLIAIAISSYKWAPILSLGLSFFLIGHSMESSFLSLELVHEHRNYFPSYGIILIAVYYIFHSKLETKYLFLTRFIVCVFIAAISTQTYIRSTYWGDLAKYIVINAKNHPNSQRSNETLGQLFSDIAISSDNETEKIKYAGLARSHFEKSTGLSQTSVNGLINTLILDSRLALPYSKEVFTKLLERLKTAPISDNISNQIVAFENRCNRTNPCQLSQGQIHSIYDAILSNPTLIGRSKSKVLMAYAQNLLLSNTDISKATKLVMVARDAYPKDIYINISAIKLFIKLNQIDTAMQLLKETEKLDRWNIYDENLQFLSHQITAL